jgi:hypothetical protein
LDGREIPPTRRILRTRSMFGYHAAFLENFPLLYPGDRQAAEVKEAR